MFPINFGQWILELTRINNHVKDKNLTSFVLHLNVAQYCLDKDIVFLNQQYSLDVSLMDLPRLLKDELLIIDDVMKTLVIQLIKQSSVLLDQENKSINLKNKGVGYLKIVKSKLIHNNHESDLLTSLFKLKTKYPHILKTTIGTDNIAFYKGKWCYLAWKNPLKEDFGYSSKRSFRFKRVLTNQFKETSGIIVSNYIDKSKTSFINIGERLFLDKYTALNYSSSLTITKSSKILNITNGLTKIRPEHESKITYKEINNVDLSFAGRDFLNDLIDNSLDFGFNLLTKKDLILIWNKSSIGYNNFSEINDSIRIIKGSGDAIIDIIKTALKNVLYVGKSDALSNDNLIINRLLHALERVQRDIDRFFVSSSLYQYLNQVNNLSELSHKNKLIYMEERGLTSQNTVIRSTKNWHLAKICPIESPERQNIELVLSLASYANVDINGNIITGFFKTHDKLISNNIAYLNYFESKKLNVALPYKENQRKWTTCIDNNKTIIINRNKIDLNLISNTQVFSPIVCLIPFLGHNDPTRALMAANMQKQVIPLLNPRPPLVSTGEEYNIMKKTGHNVVVHKKSIVINADTNKIIIYEPRNRKQRSCFLLETGKSNQEICQRLQTIVDPGQVLRSDDIIAECQSNSKEVFSLGTNLLATFMNWHGYNFEDSIIISENIINRDIFKSLHIEELKTKILKTIYGNEWLTTNIAGVSMKHRRWLDSDGIVKKGSIVQEGDVLIGKLSPKADTKQKKSEFGKIYNKKLDSNEKEKNKEGMINEIKDMENNTEGGNKREKEMFAELANNTSLRVPKGIGFATVLEVERYSNEEQKYQDKDLENYIYCYNIATKKYIRRCSILLQTCSDNKQVNSSLSRDKVVQEGLELLYKTIFKYLTKLKNDFLAIYNRRLTSENQCDKEKVLEIIKIKLLIHRTIKVGDKIYGKHGNKGVISKIVPKEDMPFMADGTPIDIILNPLGVPSRMNIDQILEISFNSINCKWGLEFKHILNIYNQTNNDQVLQLAIPKLTEMYPNINKFTKNVILTLLNELSRKVKITCSLFSSSTKSHLEAFNKRLSIDSSGKIQLYDGITGMPFDKKTIVGIIYIYKLNHLVDNKMHAKSTGPYTIVTQQSLKEGGNLGGQGLGEMEVWALQSYGTAHLLNESLTTRNEIQRTILKIKPQYKSHQWESTLVIIKELFAMCIEIKGNK